MVNYNMNEDAVTLKNDVKDLAKQLNNQIIKLMTTVKDLECIPFKDRTNTQKQNINKLHKEIKNYQAILGLANIVNYTLDECNNFDFLQQELNFVKERVTSLIDKKPIGSSIEFNEGDSITDLLVKYPNLNYGKLKDKLALAGYEVTSAFTIKKIQ